MPRLYLPTQRSALWFITHPWTAYALTLGAMSGVMFLLPPVSLDSPKDIERALHLERVLGDIVLGLCYAWYVVGIGQLSVRSRPHALLALFIASLHMIPIWEMKKLNAVSDHHPWGAWEQSSTLLSLFILFIGVPMFANWLFAECPRLATAHGAPREQEQVSYWLTRLFFACLRS